MNDKEHTYQKVSSNKKASNKTASISKNASNDKLASSIKNVINGNQSKSAKKKSSQIPICNSYRLNEPIYQSTTSTEKRKARMNRILENQSKIYVTMNDLK